MSELCRALVSHPPHYVHRYRCMNKAKTERAGVKCCGVHARQADKWAIQGRMETMIEHWWMKP